MGNRINRSRNHNRSTSDILSDIKALSAHLDDFIEDDDEDDDTNDDNTLSTDQMQVRIPNNRHLRLGGDGSLNEMLHYVAALENEEIDDDVAHFVSNVKENKKHKKHIKKYFFSVHSYIFLIILISMLRPIPK